MSHTNFQSLRFLVWPPFVNPFFLHLDFIFSNVSIFVSPSSHLYSASSLNASSFSLVFYLITLLTNTSSLDLQLLVMPSSLSTPDFFRREGKDRACFWYFLKLIHSHSENSAALLSPSINFHVNVHLSVTGTRNLSLDTGWDANLFLSHVKLFCTRVCAMKRLYALQVI